MAGVVKGFHGVQHSCEALGMKSVRRSSGAGLAALIAVGAMIEPRLAGAEDALRSTGAPPTTGSSSFYLGNREPLLPNPLLKLPIGAIKPRGWLRQQLDFMAEGMFGRLGEVSHWCRPEGSAWMDPRGQGGAGWEELPYWLKGLGDLGYILRDERVIAEASRWLEAALRSQEEDGYFGPRENKDKHDVWPNMPMLNALQSYHEA